MFRLALLLSLGFLAWSGFVGRDIPSPSVTAALEAREDIVSFPARPPVASFSVHIADVSGRLTLPAPPDATDTYLDRNGVPVVRIDGVDHFHVAAIARAAAETSGVGDIGLDMEKTLERAPALTEAARAALDWLDQNGIRLENEAVVWHYTFDHAFGALSIRGGWPSAYGQANVIKALILAERRAPGNGYLRLARRAGLAYGIPCERGGLRCRIGNVPWFAEIPVPEGQAPMILNGHLYSVLMLHRLWQATGDPRIGTAYAEGLASARAMLLRYDTGYWTAYALSPRLSDLTLYIGPGGADTELREVTAISAFTNPSFIRISVTPSATFPGNGVGGLTTGTPTGAIADGVATVYLLPGRPTDLRNLAMSAGFDVAVRYAAPDCNRLWIATTDWRASEFARQVIVPSVARREGEECVATAHLPNSLVQWSTVVPFYHDWHTRLVDALWRATGDPLFYAAAVRWYRYAEEYKRLEAAKATGVQQPVFTPRDDPADDAALLEALGGADPDNLTDIVISTAVRLWVRGHGESPERERALLARAGLRAEAATP